VQLLTAAGVQEYSQVGIPFLEANQEARIVRVVAVRSDGQEVELLANAPTDVAPVFPPNLPIYSDLRIRRAAISRLRAGDRLDFTTEVRARPLGGTHVWTEALFANGLDPAKMSYELDLPERSPLRIHVRPGFVAKFEERTGDGRHVRRWTVERAAPGSKAATLSPAAGAATKKATPEIQVTSFTSWDEMASWWASLAPAQVDAAVRSKAEELTRGLSTPAERLAAIHKFAAQEIQYLSLPLGIGRFKARESEEILRSGVGDCKDKVRLVLSLAEASGLDVDAVLVNVQGERELVPEVPSVAQFDHVIGRARVDGREVWFDPTSEMSRLGELPRGERALDGVAIVTTKPGAGPDKASARGVVVKTPESNARPSAMRSEAVGTIAADGTIRGTVRTTLDGDEEALRFLFKYGSESDRRLLVSRMSVGWGEKAETKAVRFLDPNRLDEPFWFEAEIEHVAGSALWRDEGGLALPAAGIWLESPPRRDSADGATEGPDRVEFTDPARQLVRSKFELPAGVAVQPPVPVSIERDFAHYRSGYRVDSRTVEVERELDLKVSELASDRFADLRNFRGLLDRDAVQAFELSVPEELAKGAESADELLDRCDDAIDDQRYLAAVDACRRSAELAPNGADVWNSLGIALDNLDRGKEAKVAYERQIEVDPHHGFAYANLGLQLWNAGDLVGAERGLRRQIEVAPLEPFAYSRLGRLLTESGRLTEAEPVLRNALKLDSEDARAVSSLVEVLGRLGRYGELVQLVRARRPLLTEELGLPILAYVLTLDLEAEALELAPLVTEYADRAASRLEGEIALPPDARTLGAVYAVVAGWEIRARLALSEGDLARAWNLFDAALRLSLSASAAEGCSRVRRAEGKPMEADRLLAVAVGLGAERERFERAFARQVPA
jgi:Flp pilus assembly protein TadD